MFIHLKRGERMYVNGAVLRPDRRTTLEFLNDVHFLLEHHMMQAEDATTPCRELYFIVQSMLICPEKAETLFGVYRHLSHRASSSVTSVAARTALGMADERVGEARFFEALRHIRSTFEGTAQPLLMEQKEMTR